MTEIFKYKIIAILLLVILNCSAVFSQNTLDKSIHKSFVLNEDTYVEISNQYGEIEVSIWDKDSIGFDIEIEVRSERDIDLTEIMDRIVINFRANSNYVLAETEWSDEVGFFKKGVQNIKQGIGFSENIEVNYKVRLPKNKTLEINNKFGNVYIGDYDGPLTMNIEHGDLRARKLTNVKKIELKYGKLKISEMDRGTLKLSAVKSATLTKAKDIMITSSSSEIEIDHVDVLNIDSKHDDIRIEEVNKLFGKISLTDLKVVLISKESRLKSKYGSIYFKEIESSTNNIDIEGDKTDIFLNFNETFDGLFNIQVDEENKLALLESLNIKSKERNSDSGWQIKASQGDGTGTAVNIVSIRGFVQVGD